MTYLLALDQGTSSLRSIVFDADGRVVAMAQREIRQMFPQPARSSTIPTTSGRASLPPRARPWPRPASRQGHCSARHHQPARDHRGVTSQDRRAHPQRDRLAGPARRAHLPGTARARPRGCGAGTHGPGHRCLLFRQQAEMDPRPRRWRPRCGRTRRAGLGHRGQPAGVEAHRRPRACGGVSDASRTMLFNVRRNAWDEQLLELLEVPRGMLPSVRPSAHIHGETEPALFGAPIRRHARWAVAGQ